MHHVKACWRVWVDKHVWLVRRQNNTKRVLLLRENNRRRGVTVELRTVFLSAAVRAPYKNLMEVSCTSLPLAPSNISFKFYIFFVFFLRAHCTVKEKLKFNTVYMQLHRLPAPKKNFDRPTWDWKSAEAILSFTQQRQHQNSDDIWLPLGKDFVCFICVYWSRRRMTVPHAERQTGRQRRRRRWLSSSGGVSNQNSSHDALARTVSDNSALLCTLSVSCLTPNASFLLTL